MNNIKTREEFLNEGFYKWMNKKAKGKFFIVAATIVSLIFALPRIITDPVGDQVAIDIRNLEPLIFWLIFGFLNFPLTYHVWKSFLRNIYHKIRGGTLVKSADEKIKYIENNVKKDPAIEKRLLDVKRSLRTALENKDKKKISSCVHEIYEISLILKKRNKYTNLYNKSNVEKNIEIIDPYNEEKWSE